MHVHNVYFRMKPGADSQAVAAFEQGLAELAKDPVINSAYFGKPAATDRDVVENSYAYGLVFVFDDLAAHDQYQAGAVHLKFVEDHRSLWEKVVVHDIET